MQIRSAYMQRPQVKVSQAASSPSQDNTPKDSYVNGETLAGVGIGLTAGVVGIGAPVALAMGSAKSFMNGSPLLGVGLAVATVAAGSSLGMMALMGAAMSTDSGSGAGFYGYLAGGVISSVAAGFAIF